MIPPKKCNSAKMKSKNFKTIIFRMPEVNVRRCTSAESFARIFRRNYCFKIIKIHGALIPYLRDFLNFQWKLNFKNDNYYNYYNY